MKLASRENTLVVMVCLAILGVGFSITSIVERQRTSDHRRYVRCVQYDKPMNDALRKLMTDLSIDSAHQKTRDDYRVYLKATKGKLKGPCGDFPETKESAGL